MPAVLATVVVIVGQLVWRLREREGVGVGGRVLLVVVSVLGERVVWVRWWGFLAWVEARMLEGLLVSVGWVGRGGFGGWRLWETGAP